MKLHNRWLKKHDRFPYRATLINKGIFLRQKDLFAKSLNIKREGQHWKIFVWIRKHISEQNTCFT